LKYSREYLERLAGTTGFLPDTLEKVLRLERMLTLVGEHPFLGPRLVLKGGTALNLFYQQAPRLSVDLDFNYVGSADRDILQRERPDIERAVEQLAGGEAYQLQRAPEEHAGRKFYLGYWNAAGTPDRIEVDLNYLFRVPLVPPVRREGWTPDPDVPCRGRIAGADEVWAGKLLALLDRVAARDLYDAAQLAEMPPSDPVAFRRLFIGLSGILPRPLTAYDSRHLRALSQADLDRQLVPFLRREGRASREALEVRAAQVLSPLLDLSAPEREYVERLQWGEFHPELIAGDDQDLVDRLRIHPALLWKIQNARSRRR
jgi:predicted nucleotidyltransferase component of viral defense system